MTIKKRNKFSEAMVFGTFGMLLVGALSFMSYAGKNQNNVIKGIKTVYLGKN